jgi:hypothetical protein
VSRRRYSEAQLAEKHHHARFLKLVQADLKRAMANRDDAHHAVLAAMSELENAAAAVALSAARLERALDGES